MIMPVTLSWKGFEFFGSFAVVAVVVDFETSFRNIL